MNPNELRDGFLDFFAERGHTICSSDSLVPENDPSLLFTPAGMNQFKDMYMGIGTRTYTRAASSQKCLRMPDLDRVGETASHHTFFEMLGNFSFGDYFKKEAIAWSLEYLVDLLGMDFKTFNVSVYQDDDEAARLWLAQGIPEEKLYRFGEKSNFWPAEAPSKGPNGVCGPCSEIHVDLGGGCGRSDCNPECDCGRFVEVWNLVFTQFLRKDGGVLEPLPSKNIDTGMGFERLLRVLEGVPSNFDTSLFRPIIASVSALAKKEYGADPRDDVRIRRIADHVRGAVFCISDGISPSNEKQGYVVRKILRRAILDGHNLGIEGHFLNSLVAGVADLMGEPYPVIREQEQRITRDILREEEKFAETFIQGSSRLDALMAEMEKKGETVLEGRAAFLLYDTFGFPLDLTMRMIEERGWKVDREGFEQEMEAQRTRARAGSVIATEIFDMGPLARISGSVPETEFIGYGSTEKKGRVVALLTKDGLVDEAQAATRASLILDQTPFYAESGGQVGDRGTLLSDSFSFAVETTSRERGFHLHTGTVTEGSVIKGAEIRAEVHARTRGEIQCHHTATHLLHWALRKVLGEHVEQAGSLVEEKRLRFDFHHPAAMTDQEIGEVQSLVNQKIRSNLPVEARVLPLDEAKKMGAMALFGEKYGESVRVITIGSPDSEEKSIELCGGTHVPRTGDIGSFMIVGEESVAAGIRRVEAITSTALDRHVASRLGLLKESAAILKTQTDQLPQAIRDMQMQVKAMRKEIARLKEKDAAGSLDSIFSRGMELGDGMSFFTGRLDGLSTNELKKLVDKVRARREEPFAIILISKEKDRANVVAMVDEPLLACGVSKAGDICRELGKKLGGGGGGRPGMAQGQGKASGDLDQLLEEAREEAIKNRKA